MISKEIENINKFKNAFPEFLQEIISKHPFSFNLRTFKKWALDAINQLSFAEYNIAENDQIYDATISCVFNGQQLNCPVSINITKLIQKTKDKPKTEFFTKDLYELVHPDVKQEIFTVSTSHISSPLLLKDENFYCQLIDGNHRVVANHRNDIKTTYVILINSNDLKDCLEFKDFETIIKVFSKLNTILKKYN